MQADNNLAAKKLVKDLAFLQAPSYFPLNERVPMAVPVFAYVSFTKCRGDDPP
jgi:hypothetical protein